MLLVSLTHGGIPWDFALILVVLAVLVPWRGAARIKELLARPSLDTRDRLALYASTIAFQWAAVAVVAWRWFARGLTAQHLGLALPEPALAAATALPISILLGVSQLWSLRRMARVPPERQGFLHRMARTVMPQNLVEALAFVALATTVALCEEFLYRGFAFAVLEDASANSVALAALGSSALFALAHIYQGRRGLGTTFVVGLVFAGMRVWTASLAPSILAHLVTDLVAGLAGPRLLSSPWRLARTESAPPPQTHNPEDKQ